MTLLEALRDPNLFASFFKDVSWARWKIFLAALFAEAVPDEGGLEIYRTHTGRTTWPLRAFREAVLIVGRRGGKSRIMGLIAVFLACFRDYSRFLAPGQKARIAVLAKDRDQAREIFNYVIGLLEETPLLASMVVRRDTETIELNNNVVIAINTASFRSTRGFTFAAVLADEVAYWHSDEYSANPDIEILRALRPGLASIPGAPLVIASSPYAKKGELWNGYRRHYGKDDARVLAWKATTAEMNSSLDPAVIAEAYEADPEAAKADYGAEFRSDLVDFITVEQIEAATCWGRSELPPQAGVNYVAFVDPSGGGADAMTLAIAHLEGDMCVLDVVLVIVPPFDTGWAVEQCVALLRRYGVTTVTGDHYAGNWPKERFKEHGVDFVISKRFKSEIYIDFLFLLNSHRVELLDHVRIRHEAVNLERQTSRGGKDSVDHARNTHDDLINACAGVLTLVDLDRRPALVELASVTGVDGASEGEGLPAKLDYLFLVVIDSGADVAALFCGSYAQQLYILDVEAVFLRPGLFRELSARLWQMTFHEWHITRGITFAPAHLLGLLGGEVYEIDDKLKPEELIAFTSEYIKQRRVKFGPATKAKMATKTIAAALTLRAGDPIETALQSALIFAVWLEHGGR
jgi:hypothetical protein